MISFGISQDYNDKKIIQNEEIMLKTKYLQNSWLHCYAITQEQNEVAASV